MAKFLNTSATNYFLEELIKTASERLTLISPFLKLNDRVKELLEDKDRLKIDVRIVYGKNELQPEEINWLRELSFVRTSFCKNLHAKCYLNEKSCIITSLNLYEFSQVNNNEMGVLLSRDDDAELYRDAYEEAQRIIRISDEVRMSLERVETSNTAAEQTSSQSIAADTDEKLSSSRVAKHLGMSTKEFLSRLTEAGYLIQADSAFSLTDKGTEIGAERRVSKRFGEYFVWPLARMVDELSE
ncbi:MAG: phospholipase D family protein [Abyssibacter sp.]|uniref:phospholipase D family protein n=1 Tax=Abyssibacter sp. TaxID=2320200 RepID=UPI00321B77F6